MKNDTKSNRDDLLKKDDEKKEKARKEREERARQEALKKKQAQDQLETNIKFLRTQESSKALIVLNKLSSFVGILATVALLIDWKSQLLGYFPWLRELHFGIELPLLERTYVIYVTHIRPFIVQSLSWLTRFFPWNSPPWFFDYVFLNSILLSRPLSILFIELSLDVKANKTETKANSRYLTYKALSLVSSLPPIFYILSLVLFFFGAIVVFTISYSALKLGSLVIGFPVVFAACAIMIVIFELIDILLRRSKLLERVGILIRFGAIGIGWLLVTFLLALSPYFAPIVGVYAVFIYRSLVITPTRTSMLRIAISPWIHFLSILIGAILVLMFFSTVDWHS